MARKKEYGKNGIKYEIKESFFVPFQFDGNGKLSAALF